MTDASVKSLTLIFVDTDDDGAHFTLLDPDGGARNLVLSPGARLEVVSTARIPSLGIKEHPAPCASS